MRMRPTGVWPWLVSLATACVLLLTAVDGQRGEDQDMPTVFNLASRATIKVNATCGMNGREKFCKLVEHNYILQARNLQCDYCDARSPIPELRHPIQHAIDGTKSWWQSPTLANGQQYNNVDIELDLQQVYHIAYVILKAANAPRPGNWILEASTDGINWKVWQYFVMEDRDCQNLYNMDATIGLPVFVRDDQVICTSRHSALNPLEDGEIFVSLINERPGAYRPSKALLDFTVARFIRLRLQKIRTLLGDLMDDRDDKVTERYFYSIKDISIGGQCICYGHASTCRRPSPNDLLRCSCGDFTMGDNCELCQPLYNQKPWQVKSANNGGCEKCNCHGKADRCVYNATVAAKGLSLNEDGIYNGGGVCLNCQEYTAGINCEKCLPGYFRPMRKAQTDRYPCVECNCMESHSSSANCVQDDSRLSEGLKPGDCLCKEGYAGRSCDSCAVGYYGFPNCRQCRCDVAGSKNPENCDRRCDCKVNVAGSRCDVCKGGYFNLDIENEFGCTECFCFGASTACESVGWGLSKVYDMKGWMLSQLDHGGLTVLPRLFDGWLEAKVYLGELGRTDPRTYRVEDIHYWVAPMSYLGNRLSSYGGYLRLTLRYILDMRMRYRYHLGQPNFILKGSNLTIYAERYRLRENREHELQVQLHEKSWKHLEDNSNVTREEMMTLLYNLERVLIRGTHDIAQDTAYIKDVYLDVASPMVMDGSSLKTVEQCRCPRGHAGLSCESCIPGYRRVNNQLFRGRCVECQCNNHADECDPYNGKCLECKHSTAGDNCERCLPGFYGDPRYGSPDDCKPCACPLVSGNNFFADQCIARPTSENPDAYECVNCREGYTGARCQLCAPGFYGNPIVPGGSCRRCSCGGNIDPSQPGSCNPNTGVCNLCTNNTEGKYCERCISGYYGSAVNGDCRPCQCSEYGAAGQNCNPRTGQCKCRDKFIGRKCDHCQRGYGNVDVGCERCNCDRTGSESLTCDPVSGQCRCKPGVGGMTCSQCSFGYYDFSRSGCKDCQCYGPGTSNVIYCDHITGTCLCKPGVVGQTCDSCRENHFGLGSEEGCTRCDCDRQGSYGPECDEASGQCSCKPGVGGRKCDSCLPGYFDFGETGCQECEPCEEVGHVCDPLTGQCTCPPNTEGPICEFCRKDTWDYDKDGGCKLCNCSSEGSVTQQCDPNTGSCQCREGFHGYSCDGCLAGFHSFPECQECACNHAGSLSDTCPEKAEYCECNSMGQCYCKKNVEGQQCDRCIPGAFSLDRENPYGCTKCYCFKRAQSCRQAPYIWREIELPDMYTSLYTLPDGGDSVSEKFGYAVLIQGRSYVPPELITKPMYWQLNLDEMDSDMVLSYNGRLDFHHHFMGPAPTTRDEESEAPLVILIGNGIELHHKRSHLEPNSRQYMSVKLHEALWHFPGQNDSIDRSYLMITLQNVSTILVRAAQDGSASRAGLQEVLIQRAVPQSPDVISLQTAIGVEICDCPDRFSGSSCQNPGKGHYRVPPLTDDINLSEPEGIIGSVRPCQCFGHSQLCNPDTGECEMCLHNTEGRNCERCTEGYYGEATRGTPNDCQPCSCPLPEPSNSFSPTCEGSRNGLVCTSCSPEYEGMRCERCAPGYYGNPQKLGETCKPCQCSIEGSSSQVCDPVNGQCPCLSGISGRTCEVCTDETTGVQGGKCVSCYTGCTGVLLSELANRSLPLPSIDTSGMEYPWDDLNHIQTQVKDLRGKMDLVEQAGGVKVKDLTSEVKYLETAADRLINRLDTVGSTACKMEDVASHFLTNVTELQGDVNSTYEEIKATVEYIHNLTRSLKGDYQGLNMSAALEAAKDILAEIQATDFTPQDKAILAEHMAAEMLIERISKFTMRSIDTNRTKDHLDELNRRLNDLSEQSQMANDTAEEALNKIKQLMRLLDTLNEIKKKIEEMASESFDLLEEARDLLVEADSTLYTSEDFTYALTRRLEILRNKVNSLREAVPKLEERVEKAMEHAEMLRKQAKELDDLYELVRNQSENAVKAAKAYESIVDAIKEARTSAEKALDDAKVSKKIAGVDNMTDEVARLIRRSRELKMEAETLQDSVESLTEPLKNLQNELDGAQDDHKHNKNLLKEMDSDFDLLEENLSDKISDFFPVIEDANEKSKAALEILKKINREKEETKVKELGEIPKMKDELSDTLAIAKKDEDNVAKLNELKRKVDERMAANARKAVNIGYNLEELRAKIKDARTRVNNMKLSLKSDGQCFRTYQIPTLKPTATNEMRFAFKPESPVTDALLLLLEQSPEEFLAADITNQKVRFIWNSGSGVGSVSHYQVLDPDKWYHVMAKRIGSLGQLKVWPEDEQEDLAEKVSDNLGAGCSLMNLNENSTMYLAGSGNGVQIPSAVSGENFKGCLGDIFLDSHRLGVYNFKSNVEDHCDACEEVPQLAIGVSTYLFNGRGFARYEVGRYSSKKTLIHLKFKTFYEDSRIFFVGSEENGDYVSIELKDGHVLARFYMGGISEGLMKTDRIYNTNQWIELFFDRRYLDGYLKVGSEEIRFKAPPGNTGLDIGGAPMYFGGVPTTMDISKFRGLEENGFFYGCMKDLSFFSGTPESDTSLFVNVQKSAGCRENGISTVDFRGDGQLQFENDLMSFKDNKNDISLTFITTKADALVLRASDELGNHYYTMSLVSGRLEVSMKGDGTEELKIRSQETFADGKTHCVTLSKDGQRLRLLANDQELGVAQADDSQSLNLNTRTLWLGGFVSKTFIEKFDGCISDVIVNGNLLSMADASQWKNADVGRCRFTTDINKPVVVASESSNQPTSTAATTTAVATTTTVAPAPLALADPEDCPRQVKPEEEQNARSVGLSGSFHAEIMEVRRRDIAKSFNFTFDFRTYYENGLFWYLTNVDKTFYLGVQLVKGQLEVAYLYENSRVSLSFEEGLSDGLWHSVQLQKAGKVLSLSYDDRNKKTMSVDARLDFKPPIHLGGPQRPEDFRNNDINLVNSSIRGCIRNLMVNQKEISINNASVIQDHGTCFKNVEPGVYFDGAAWAVYETDFVIKEDTTMRLDFKSQSLDGILISVGSDDDSDFGLTLELDKGKIKFGLRNKDGEFRIESDNTNKLIFCDGQWHTVYAAVSGSKLSIKVDEGNVLSRPVTGTSEDIKTMSPLFIGGYKSQPTDAFRQPVSLSQDQFNGCMKKVEINGKEVDWYKLENENSLRKSACPKF